MIGSLVFETRQNVDREGGIPYDRINALRHARTQAAAKDRKAAIHAMRCDAHATDRDNGRLGLLETSFAENENRRTTRLVICYVRR